MSREFLHTPSREPGISDRFLLLLRHDLRELSLGVSQIGIEHISVVRTTQEYPLGARGKFWCSAYGMSVVRYVKFSTMVAGVGGPVGFLAAAATFNWIVTNDFSASAAGLACGLLPQDSVPASGSYGWVLVQGANRQAVGIKGAESHSAQEPLAWTDDDEVSSASVTFDIAFARKVVTGSKAGSYAVGEFYVSSPWFS